MMLDYLGVFCQLKKRSSIKKLLLLLVLASCSSSVQRVLVAPKPVWLDAPAKYRLTSLTEGVPAVHPFFDHLPFFDIKNNLLNVIVTTPAGSEVEYGFDLLSGKFYAKRLYCDQEDVWETYAKTLDRPPYTQAIVPRLLDSMGGPQQVVIFGSEDFFKKFYSDKNTPDALKSVRVRVVGSQILQFCELYPCKRNQWQSRLLLLAVDPFDKKFKNVKTLAELKKEVSWKYIKAFLENGEGRSFDGMKKSHGKPAYRLLEGADGSRSLKFAISRGHYFKFKEMREIRKNCFKLYDYIWNSSRIIRQSLLVSKREKKHAKSSFDDLAKRKTILSGNVLQSIASDTGSYRKKKHREYKQFSEFMKKLVKNYAEEFYLCSKYVRASSINDNPERAHFMDSLIIFFNLDRLGHDFNCMTGAWMPRKRFYLHNKSESLYDRIKQCDTPRLNRIFSTMRNYLNALSKTDHPSYFYIDYDMAAYGTHQKLYAWIPSTGKRILCNDDYDGDGVIVSQKSFIQREIMPDDFRWKNFIDASQKLFEQDGYIR